MRAAKLLFSIFNLMSLVTKLPGGANGEDDFYIKLWVELRVLTFRILPVEGYCYLKFRMMHKMVSDVHFTLMDSFPDEEERPPHSDPVTRARRQFLCRHLVRPSHEGIVFPLIYL